jgi:nucleotide-binding universal stress UspA family protein
MGRNGFKKIMIATDGSDCSMLAAGIGIELARLSSGPVYAMYVISTNYSSYVGVEFNWGEIYEAFKKDGENAFKKIKKWEKRQKLTWRQSCLKEILQTS